MLKLYAISGKNIPKSIVSKGKSFGITDLV